ncbi:MAG: ATP-binding protein, partial [Sedimenticolaceae bacterium]|nr:ATP-binding protein [Sedimenticolaceae bacterium]
MGFGFRWLAESGGQQFTIQVDETMDNFAERKRAFQRKLWSWLLVPAGLLLLIQLAVLAWVMRPLKLLANEIRELEQGRGDQVDGRYPKELHPLQAALNTLLRQERTRRERYRQALDDLAHSLKTPLAVIRNLVHEKNTEADREVSEQALRMQEIISRQLGRAAGQSRALLAAPVEVLEPLGAVIRSLQKVYVDKGLEFRVDLENDLAVRIDRADLLDVLGNLLDNACKWARRQVEVTGLEMDGFVEIRISDDGPGFPEDAARMLERGLRADSKQEGQGLGLALVREIVTAAGGSIELVDRHGEGACVRLLLPA